MMKKSLFYLLFALPLLCFSQNIAKIKVQETRETFKDGTQNAFIVDVYVKEQEFVEKEIRESLKKQDAKVTVKKEIFADNAKFSFLGDNTADVYAKIQKKADGVYTITMAVDLGGAFLSSKEHEKQAEAFETWLYELAIRVTKQDVARETKDAEKILSKQEKELNGLKSDNMELENDINNYNQKIENAKKQIENNKKTQEELGKKILDQKEVVKKLQEKEKAVQ
jgi:hypothetical protein